jgi:ParB family chromosome partitioning protein
MDMSTKKPKGLGRGLSALLDPVLASSGDATPAGTPMLLPLDSLMPGPYQPRTRMDEGALYELAESIKSQGIMQPILVRRVAELQTATAPYEIIAGERRVRAARLAGLAEVPALVREVPDEAAAAMALIENIQREDLNPLEEAQGLRRLVDEFGLTHEQAAQAIGKSRSGASNLLRLLNLSQPVQTMLMAGDIDMGHARALLALDGAAQITAANQVSARELSVREAEALVKRLNAGVSLTLTSLRKPAPDKPGDVRRVEEELSDLLLAQVEVRVKKKGRQQSGEVVIQFGSLDELNGLLERLRGD